MARAYGCRAGGLGFESQPRGTNLCGNRKPDSVSFRRAVERRRFHTHDTKPRQHNNTITNALHFGTGSRSVTTRCRSPLSSRMTNMPSIVCLRKGFLLQVTHGPHYNISRYQPSSRKWRSNHTKINLIRLSFSSLVGVVPHRLYTSGIRLLPNK